MYWPLFGAFVASWCVIYYCLRKGVELSGKIAVVTVLTPYILLTIFLLRVLVLPGMKDGLMFLLVPDVAKLF